MLCEKCKEEFQEKDLDDSHDIPCYLFWNHGPTRKERKKIADLYPRHYLCKKCHYDYDEGLRISLVLTAKKFSKKSSHTEV